MPKVSDIYALDSIKESIWKESIDKARKSKDSIGGSAFVRVSNAPIGLGEPIYHKMDSILASGMMSINGVKAVEIGEGVNASKMLGSPNNDEIRKDGFLTNKSGGILGGISNGDDIDIKVHFKPTPSIFKEQRSLDPWQ